MNQFCRQVRAALLGALALAAACGRATPQFATDRIGSFLDGIPEANLLRAAPVVLLATVSSHLKKGPPLLSRFTPGNPSPSGPYLAQAYTVTCNLEETIRSLGAPHIGSTFQFEYFAVPGSSLVDSFLLDAPDPEENEEKRVDQYFRGQNRRFLFFLETEVGHLRAVRDSTGFALPVFGGALPTSHRTLDFPDSRFGKRIAEILLTVRPGFDDRRFARVLAHHRSLSETLSYSRLAVFHLTEALLSAPSPLTRAAACHELVRAYPGQLGCFAAIANDPAQDEEVRVRARKRQQGPERLLKRLADPAEINFGGTDSVQGNIDDLVILLGNSDPRVRNAACVAMKRYFPRTPEAKVCTAKAERRMGQPN